MTPEERAVVEAELRRLAAGGALADAATVAVRAYGSELFGFLVGLSRDRDRAEELFGDLCERIWRGLPGFRWESSFRVWAYALARHLFLDGVRGRKVRAVPLSAAPELAAAARSATATWLGTEVRGELARLRETLDPEERMLLGLRLESEMGWRDIARVLGGDDDLDRRAAALRKRFERLKQRLEKELT